MRIIANAKGTKFKERGKGLSFQQVRLRSTKKTGPDKGMLSTGYRTKLIALCTAHEARLLVIDGALEHGLLSCRLLLFGFGGFAKFRFVHGELYGVSSWLCTQVVHAGLQSL